MEHLSHETLKTLAGQGIISNIGKVIWSPKLDGYTNKTQNALLTFGDVPITKMEIYRTPLHSIFTKAINAISLGKFAELQRRLGYDKLFHLALVCTLLNNKKVIIQKLDVIEVSPAFATKANTEVLDVDYQYRGLQDEDHLTINELFSNARQHVPDNLWFGYDALKNNCQNFIRFILEYSDLYDKKAKDFLFQNIDVLVKELPEYVGETMNFVTDGASTFTRLTGKGNDF